ncbi:MAG: hypothetical protein IJ067_01445 [Prevotella sp.]|nr:hypothetical protein [Prevotella sp.]
MLSKKYKYLSRAACLAALLLLFISCTGGDDDGRRLGETIVGTWQRGWNEGDIIIEGNVGDEFTPDKIDYDLFIFQGDGSYNGMVRKGSFFATEVEEGEVVFKGNYQCDNSNLKLEGQSGFGYQSLLLQILSFTDDIMQVRYVDETYHVTVTLTIRKISDSVDY